MSMTTVSSDSSGGNNNMTNTNQRQPPPPSRYESQKRRDWNTFGQYLKNHRPPLALSRCSGAHVLEFLRYLDQFGKTKVHLIGCPFFGQPNPPAPCPCPLRQAWGSLDALIGRLRAAFEENGGQPETNPFGARAVRLYLREIRDSQSKARGIAYEKKKRKKPPTPLAASSVGGARPVVVAEKLQVGDLNSSDTTVGYEYDCHQQHTHYQFRENFGRHLVFGSSSDVPAGSMMASTSGGHGGGVGGDHVNGRGGVSLFGGSDERLLLFQCSPGSLL